MTKTYYYLIFAVIFSMVTACEDFNERNFPGYDDAAAPTNLAMYSYTLTSSDYATIATTIKKPVTDSIALMKTQLKAAQNATDSATINATITRLNLELTTNPVYVAATAISTNKIFADSAQFETYIPIILNTKYLYGDEKSSASVTFNLSYDTTKIAATNKFTLTSYDYEKMGKANNTQPGYNHNFSSTIDPNFYIPLFLKDSFPYSKSGDLKMVRYKYYYSSSNIPQIATLYEFDGSNWINYNASNATFAKFSFKNKTWVFVNSEILIEKFLKDFGSFTPQIVVGTYTWTWGSYNGGCIVANAFNKGASEIWMTSGSIDLKDRINPTLSFDHAINYGSGLPVPDLAGCYVSTNYTGDVTTATWTKLDITYPTTYSWTFLNSGQISLKSYINQKINIAFKYVSIDKAIGWEVSNVNVLDE